MLSATRAQGDALPRLRRRCWSSSARRAVRGAGRLGHDLPGPLPAHEDPAAGGARSSPARRPPRTSPGELGPLVERYASDYAAYYERCKRPDSPAMRDPMPVLILIPGIGLLAFQKDKQTARVAAELLGERDQRHARGPRASTSTCRSPSRRRSTSSTGCSRRPSCSACRRPSRSRAGSRSSPAARGGIGGAVARRLLDEGARVVVSDIDQAALDSARRRSSRQGATAPTACAACVGDVTSESSVAARSPGRVTSSAASTSSCRTPASPRRRRSRRPRSQSWQRNIDVLATGYFLVGRDGLRAC